MLRLPCYALVLLTGGIICTTSAWAAPTPDRFSGYVALTNNYVGRGLAQSVGEPSLLAA